MKFIITPKEQWNFIKPLWRILVAVFLAQLIGMAISMFVGKYGHPFVNLWFGGAVSSFLGFLVGLAWCRQISSKLISDNLLAVFFLGALSLIITVMAFIMPLEQFALAMNESKLR